MTKILRGVMGGTVLTAVTVSAFVLFGASSSEAADPCTRKTFQTKLVEEACKKGGRAEAKKAMKTFLKQIQAKKEDFTCLNCHVELDPSYDLKPDALKLFKEYGGK